MERWLGFTFSSTINNQCDLQQKTTTPSLSLEERGWVVRPLWALKYYDFMKRQDFRFVCFFIFELLQSTWIAQLNSPKSMFCVPLVKAWGFQMHHNILDTLRDYSPEKWTQWLEFTFQFLWILLSVSKARHFALFCVCPLQYDKYSSNNMTQAFSFSSHKFSLILSLFYFYNNYITIFFHVEVLEVTWVSWL